MRVRRSAILGAIVMLALGVSGCAAPGQTTTGTPPPMATAAPASGPATTTFGTGTALAYDCDQLLNDATLAALDSSLTSDASYRPAAGSSAEEAVAIRGTACSWSDASSQTSVVVSAAKPDATTLDTLKTAAQSSTPTSQFGTSVTAYTSGTELQLFTADGYWATADSPLLADPAKLVTVGQILLEELPAG